MITLVKSRLPRARTYSILLYDVAEAEATGATLAAAIAREVKRVGPGCGYDRAIWSDCRLVAILRDLGHRIAVDTFPEDRPMSISEGVPYAPPRRDDDDDRGGFLTFHACGPDLEERFGGVGMTAERVLDHWYEDQRPEDVGDITVWRDGRVVAIALVSGDAIRVIRWLPESRA